MVIWTGSSLECVCCPGWSCSSSIFYSTWQSFFSEACTECRTWRCRPSPHDLREHRSGDLCSWRNEFPWSTSFYFSDLTDDNFTFSLSLFWFTFTNNDVLLAAELLSMIDWIHSVTDCHTSLIFYALYHRWKQWLWSSLTVVDCFDLHCSGQTRVEREEECGHRSITWLWWSVSQFITRISSSTSFNHIHCLLWPLWLWCLWKYQLKHRENTEEYPAHATDCRILFDWFLIPPFLWVTWVSLIKFFTTSPECSQQVRSQDMILDSHVLVSILYQ